MKEQDFKEMMQQSKLEIKFPDFEEQIMQKVHQKESSRRSVWRNVKISWLFLLLGTFLGIFLTNFISDIQLPFLGEKSKLLLLVGEVLIVLVIASQFDTLVRFTFKKREE